MEYKDYYKIMGVAKDATDDEIKRAYRKLARRYHPDVSKEKDAEARFKEINEAYEVLKDPEKRKAYDHLGSDWQHHRGFQGAGGFGQGQGFGSGQAGDFSEFFEQFFGAGRRGQGSGFGHAGFGAGGFGQARSQAGEDLHTSISISLEESYTGASKTLQYEAIGEHGERVPKAISVKIPAGVSHGQQIRLSGQGGPGVQDGKAGDLYIKIELSPHALFTVEGRDLSLQLPIAPWEAALGSTISVPTLGGLVDVKIPAGAKSGAKMRLKGRGLPGKVPGDQYLVLQIQVPLPKTEAEKALYEQMAQTFAFDLRQHFG